MIVPLIDLREQYLSLKAEILDAIERTLDRGVYISGEEVEQFEKEISARVGVPYAVSTANGTDSLVLALEACGVGEGDEVITTPYTFFATAEAIARVGATPVFADIDRQTRNLLPESVESKITKKTKAILPVHLFGYPVDMDVFLELGKRYNLFVIEDACQALGSAYKGKEAGSIGDASCVSFFPTKNLGGYGDGGAVLTRHEWLAERIRLLARHGSRQKYYHETIGYNSRLDEIQAAILRVKLKKLDDWNRMRRQKATRYRTELVQTDFVHPFVRQDVLHVYHLYVVETEHRSELAEFLRDRGIATGHYYPLPLHLQEAFQSLGYRRGDLKNAEQLCERAIALPLYPELSERQQDYVISSILKFFKG